jgi:hypothetical protein
MKNTQPSNKALKFAIECLERTVEEFSKLIREYPDDPDSQENGGWWTSRHDLKEIMIWMESKISKDD